MKQNDRTKLIGQLLDKKGKASRAFVHYMDASREYGTDVPVYMREAHFVMALMPGEGRVMSEIAKALGITHGAASQLALRLEKKGYITREKSETDRRQTVARLTPKGENFYQEHSRYDFAAYSRADEQALSQFSDEELELFCHYEEIMWTLFTKLNSKN